MNSLIIPSSHSCKLEIELLHSYHDLPITAFNYNIVVVSTGIQNHNEGIYQGSYHQFIRKAVYYRYRGNLCANKHLRYLFVSETLFCSLQGNTCFSFLKCLTTIHNWWFEYFRLLSPQWHLFYRISANWNYYRIWCARIELGFAESRVPEGPSYCANNSWLQHSLAYVPYSHLQRPNLTSFDDQFVYLARGFINCLPFRTRTTPLRPIWLLS